MLACLALTVALCVALGAFHLGRAPLWSDEVFSRYYYDLFGPRFLLTDGLRLEPTPPTYPAVLWGWMAVFGDSEAALRALSLACTALCVPVVFQLGRELGSRSGALAAALLFALCPAVLYFAQEARVYAMTLLPVGLVLLACAVLLRAPRSRPAAAGYVGAATLCLYLHASLVFLVAACALVVGAVLFARAALPRRAHRPSEHRPSEREAGEGGVRALLGWIGLNAAVLVLSLPYLSHIVGASQSGGLDWIPPLRPHDVIGAVSAIVAGVLTPYPWPTAALTALVISTLAASVWVHRPSLRTTAVLILIPGVFVALVTLVSLVRPILLPRVLFWTAIPLCALLGRQMLQEGRLRWAVAAATMLAFGVGLVAQETAPDGGKEPWRQMFASLGPELAQADLVVLSPRFNPLVLKYYAPAVLGLSASSPSDHQVRLWDAQLPPTIMTQAATRMGVAAITGQQVLREIASNRSVWVLSNAVDLPYLQALQADQPAQQTKVWTCGLSRPDCVGAMAWVTQSPSRITIKQVGSGPHT